MIEATTSSSSNFKIISYLMRCFLFHILYIRFLSVFDTVLFEAWGTHYLDCFMIALRTGWVRLLFSSKWLLETLFFIFNGLIEALRLQSTIPRLSKWIYYTKTRLGGPYDSTWKKTVLESLVKLSLRESNLCIMGLCWSLFVGVHTILSGLRAFVSLVGVENSTSITDCFIAFVVLVINNSNCDLPFIHIWNLQLLSLSEDCLSNVMNIRLWIHKIRFHERIIKWIFLFNLFEMFFSTCHKVFLDL